MKRLGALGGVLAGLAVTVAILAALSARGVAPHRARTRLVAEDASAPLRRVAIHYAPSADRVALGVWRQLFAALPARVVVDVEVAAPADWARFLAEMRAAGAGPLWRFRPVVVGVSITTWSRDRYASLVDDDGAGAILAPPFTGAGYAGRTGDFRSPFAIARALHHGEPRVAEYAFEGGDFAATPKQLFVDVNLQTRNLGRGHAEREALLGKLARDFGQDIVWLGDEPGELPTHHMMMYMVPLDEHTVAVGDERAALALLPAEDRETLGLDEDTELHARRFDRAAELLAERGYHVVRFPSLVLAGGRSYVTYTNALFDREGDTRVVYLPTYRLDVLDDAAERLYRDLGYQVKRIDVAPIFRLNGSLGCLVNVLARS